MGKIKSSVSEEPNSAFTSMIDIVFLLLIFFILQPFKEPEVKMPAELPKDAGTSTDQFDKPPEDIKIRIVAVPSDPSNAHFIVDGQALGSANQGAGARLPAVLKRNSHGLEDTPVAILPDARVHFGHVLTALDACYTARLSKVKFGFGN